MICYYRITIIKFWIFYYTYTLFNIIFKLQNTNISKVREAHSIMFLHILFLLQKEKKKEKQIIMTLESKNWDASTYSSMVTCIDFDDMNTILASNFLKKCSKDLIQFDRD